MQSILNIIFYKLLSFIKVNLDLKSLPFLKNLSTLLVYLFFGAGVFLFTQNSIDYLLNNVKIGSFLLHRFISIVLFMFFLAVNVGNIIVSFSTLYRSKEVEFLVTKPVEFKNIFVVKFLDNFLYSSATLFLLICSVLGGYGSYFRLGADFYIFALVFQLLPFMLLAASVGVILLIIVISLAVKFGLRPVAGIVVFIYALSLVFFFKISSPVSLVDKVMAYYPDINRYFGFLDNPVIQLLPNHWLSESFYWFAEGNIALAFYYAIPQILLSLFFLLIAIFAAGRWYYKTWVASKDLKFKKDTKDTRGKTIFPAFEKKSLFKPQMEVLLKKEFWQFFREPSQWVHLIVMFLLLVIFLLSMATMDMRFLTSYNPALRTILYLIIFLFNTFLIASLSLRFVFPLMSLEGYAYWKIRSSPVNFNKLLQMKFLTFFIIILILGQMINFVSNINYSGTLLITSTINTIAVTVTFVSLNFGMGCMFVNYKEKNPIRIASSQGASITFLFTLIYMVLLIVVLFFPLHNYFLAFNNTDAVGSLYITSIFLCSMAVIVFLTSIKISWASLQRDF